MSISSIGGSSYLPQFASSPAVGHSGSQAGSEAAGASGVGSAAQSYLMSFASMTPAQQMQASVMSSLGVSQAQYNAMTPQQQTKIQQEIQEKLKQQAQAETEKKTGMVVDLKA